MSAAVEPASKTKWMPVPGRPGIVRKNGAGSYVVRYRDRAGRQRSKSFARLGEATQFQGRVRGGDRDTVTRRPFDAYAREWLAGYTGRKAGGFSEDTRKLYRAALEGYAIPFFGRTRVGDIRSSDIKALIASMQDRGLSDNTVRGYMTPVKAMFAEAVESDDLVKNPALVKIIGRQSNRAARSPGMLTPEEYVRFRTAADPVHHDMLDFTVNTGCRLAEVIGATWDCIVKDERGTTVFAVRQQFRNGELRPNTKTAAGQRMVPLSPGLARRLAERRIASPFCADSDPVFATPSGGFVDDDNWRARVFRPARKAAGLPWLTPHKLRHTNLSMLAANGHTAEQVQAWAGHADSRSTARYLHTRTMGSPDFLDAVYGSAGA